MRIIRKFLASFTGISGWERFASRGRVVVAV